ncbi:MAG: ABC transporter permease [Anaerolineales bacterium]|nr:ABC transporter permease [Anaerolineales bacterium]MDW8162212.1 ABC transporter permease [Anaerolineales bacterium]
MSPWRRSLALVALLAPAYGWLVFAVIAPLTIMLIFSFLNDVPIGERVVFFTFENYRDFFQHAFYWRLTAKSLLTGFYTTLLCLVLGYPMALVMAKVIPSHWRAALFMLVIVPFWSNTIVRLYSWAIVLRKGGVLDLLLQALGLSPGSLEILYTYRAILIGLVHGYLPYMVLTLYIALDRVDDSLLEAAASLGANAWQRFWRILFPLSIPGMISGSILIFIPVIGSFVEPRLLGGRAGTMIGTIIEDQFVQLFKWNFGATLSFLLLLIVLIFMLAFGLLLRRTRLLRGE